ncbi:MAG: 6-phosphogluconolactonase [candidate division NC10 bacterium]|nr:6-phosphogluconolactonase [candidate division NC10 bacterium]
MREAAGPAAGITVVADPAALAREAAERFAEAAGEALARAGRLTVALAGGTTPKLLYALLATEPHHRHLPWRETHVFWGDERCVPPDHPESNYRMAHEALLRHLPIPSEQIHRMRGEDPDPERAAAEYAERLRTAFPGPRALPRFDLVLLGMGADGHTASLFPHTQAVREQQRWVMCNRVPKLQADRLTLTAPVINWGSTILFLVAGDDKAAALQEVLEGPADPERLPAQLIRPTAGRLVWLVDRAAASRLAGRGRPPS